MTHNDRRSLVRLALKVGRYHRRLPSRHNYIVDQINHNEKTPHIRNLCTERTKVILLAREPAAGVESIIRLKQTFYNEKDEEAAEAYYRKRLTYLNELDTWLPHEQRLYVKSDDLLRNTKKELMRISEFLELERPLSPNYEVFPFTTKAGDPSKNILAGEIVKQVGSSAYPLRDTGLIALYDSFCKKAGTHST